MNSININPIAVIKSPYCELQNMPVQPCGAQNSYATIEFLEEYVEGLSDLEGFTHIYLIYHFHKVKQPQLKVIPFNDKTKSSRGVFSTRTPMHPNSLGLSLVELVNVEGNCVTIRGVDILDGTPLIDLKPYIPQFDKVSGDVTTGWMLSKSDEVEMMRSDERFL
jgi:tRNA-Thr(GGU) m(6)t(6)A37 methyltransferase TsaA